MTIDLTQMELRFGGRVLAFHAYVNVDPDDASRNAGDIAKKIIRVASGPRKDAQMCWAEGGPTRGRALWDEMCIEREIKDPPPLRYDGTVYAFHVYVNTDADPYDIHKTILRIARGPRLDTCVVWTELFENEEGVKVWAGVQDAAKQAAADPRCQSFKL